jgi:hypothetical protein
MVKLFVDYRPYLALFATRCIRTEEEIRYDYVVPDLPWRCAEVNSIFLFYASEIKDQGNGHAVLFVILSVCHPPKTLTLAIAFE